MRKIILFLCIVAALVLIVSMMNTPDVRGKAAQAARQHRLPIRIVPSPSRRPGGSYSVLGRPTIATTQINAILATYHSPAVGLGQALYKGGVTYGIDYRLIFYGYVQGQVTIPLVGHVCTTIEQIIPVYAPPVIATTWRATSRRLPARWTPGAPGRCCYDHPTAATGRPGHAAMCRAARRGVPPPKNLFRWCTPQLKIEPMEQALRGLREHAGEKLLLLTGVRVGESVARDQRIALSCAKDGAECGQGWFQSKTPEAVADVLAPCLHWRVCHVWDWLTFHAPRAGFSTQLIAEVYGGDEKEEINARTGCVGCNLASRDTALDAVLRLPSWQYLAPLKRLRPLYALLTKPQYRLRKDGTDRRKDGTLAANPMRLGPLTMEARRSGLAQVLAIQAHVNRAAEQEERPCIDLLNPQEHQRILELIAANTWPERWNGDEARSDLLLNQVLADGVIQPLLLGQESSRFLRELP